MVTNNAKEDFAVPTDVNSLKPRDHAEVDQPALSQLVSEKLDAMPPEFANPPKLKETQERNAQNPLEVKEHATPPLELAFKSLSTFSCLESTPLQK